ncbi:VOC family protein [Tersicoccus mangrovi]|uniref:VOC family protein n=1 Tax=Tersicoccus mangrovi TaxID=3121635 RepID=UPI003A7F12D9
MDWRIELIFFPVADVDEALAHLRDHGVDAQGVEELAWGRFVTFADPDGNTWTLQQLPSRG